MSTTMTEFRAFEAEVLRRMRLREDFEAFEADVQRRSQPKYRGELGAYIAERENA